MSNRRRRSRQNQRTQRPKEQKKPKVTKQEGVKITGTKTTYTYKNGKLVNEQTGVSYPTSSYASLCDHWRQPFRLEDGLTVYLSAWSDEPRVWGPDEEAANRIDYGVYLDSMWGTGKVLSSPGLNLPWEAESRVKTVMYPWPDMSVPRNLRRTIDLATWIIDVTKAGKRVDIGCFGGHGRTGTLLAMVLVMQGLSGREAIARVRQNHCSSAIETYSQVKMIHMMAYKLHGIEPPGELEKGSKDTQWSGRDYTSRYRTGGSGYQGGYYGAPMSFPERDDTVLPYASTLDSEPQPDAATVVDDEEYMLWLKMNAYGNQEAAEKRGPYAAGLDDDIIECVYPPCSAPIECNMKDYACIKHEMWGDDE